MWTLLAKIIPKRLLIELIVLTALSGAVYLLWGKYQAAKENAARNASNVQALVKGARQYVFRDSLNGVKIGQLELTKKEFEKLYTDQSKLIKDLKIRLKDVQGVGVSGLFQAILSAFLSRFILTALKHSRSPIKASGLI